MSVSTAFSWPLSVVLGAVGHRRLVAACALSVAAGSVAGCEAVLAPSVTPLPSLSHSQEYRDALARTEAAIVWRAQEFAAKGVGCQSCAQVASEVAKSAQARLDAVGGLWEPWPSDLPQSALVERPFPVAEAPVSPAEFVRWLYEGAHVDLAVVASKRVSEAEQPVFAASAMARLVAAYRLAAAYDVVLPTPAPVDADGPASGAVVGGANAQSEPDALLAWERATKVGVSPSDDERAWAQWRWEGELVDEATAAASLTGVTLAELPEVSASVQAWDCAAQVLPGVGVTTDKLTEANTLANALLTRNTQVLGMGAVDTRILRCHEDNPSFSSAALRVLRADLGLLLSSDATVRAWATHLIDADMRALGSHVSEQDIAGLVEPAPAETTN